MQIFIKKFLFSRKKVIYRYQASVNNFRAVHVKVRNMCKIMVLTIKQRLELTVMVTNQRMKTELFGVVRQKEGHSHLV